MSKKLMFLVAVIACIVIGAGYYFLYFIKTPAYSIYQAYEAAKNHDVAKFEEHVDIESVYGNAYDQIAAKTVAKNPTLDKIFGGVKKYVVADLSDKAREAIAKKSEEQKAQESAPEIKKKKSENILDILDVGEQVKDEEKRFMERHLNFKYMRFKDVTTTERQDGSAIVTGKFHDIQVDKDFYLKLKLVPNANSGWKVTEVSNALDIVLERDKAATEKLAELNKNLRQEMNRLFNIKSAKAEVKTSGGFIPISRFTYTVNYALPDKNKKLASVEGKFIMYDAQGRVAQSEKLEVKDIALNYLQADYSPAKIYTKSWSKDDVLGSLFGRERGISKKGAENYKTEFLTERLILADGQKMEALTDLPEPK